MKSKTKTKSTSLTCFKCGKQWTAIFPSGVLARLAACPSCHTLNSTSAKPMKMEELEKCPGCERENWTTFNVNGFFCKFCHWGKK